MLRSRSKFGAPHTQIESDAERTVRLSKKRAALRLLFDLIAVGVIEDASPVISSLAEVMNDDLGGSGFKVKTDAPTSPVGDMPAERVALPNLAVVCGIAKHVTSDPLLLPLQAVSGTCDFQNDVHASICDAFRDADHPRTRITSILNEAVQAQLRSLLVEYFASCTAALLESYRALMGTCRACGESFLDCPSPTHQLSVVSWGWICATSGIERANQRAIQSKGELSDDSIAAYEKSKKAHDRLLSGAATIAEALGREVFAHTCFCAAFPLAFSC